MTDAVIETTSEYRSTEVRLTQIISPHGQQHLYVLVDTSVTSPTVGSVRRVTSVEQSLLWTPTVGPLVCCTSADMMSDQDCGAGDAA